MPDFLYHVTATTGDCRKSTRGEVSDEIIALMDEWLTKALNSTTPTPLPVDELAHFSAIAIDELGLVVTVFAPAGPHIKGKPHKGEVAPIATFGVTKRSRQSAALWQKLQSHFGDAEAVPPSVPWLGVFIHENLIMFSDANEWLGDFERCIAWAWLER